MECIQIVGDKNIGTTTSQYNTRWKRRARNVPHQSQTPKQVIGSKKRNKPDLIQSVRSMQGGNLSETKMSKKSKTEVEAVPQPCQDP